MASRDPNDEVLLVFCTCPDRETASGLARELVDRRLAACCNIIPGLASVFRWEDTVQEDPEVLLLAKTPAFRYKALESWLHEAHPYELPEVIAVGVKEGLAGYLGWVAEETS